MIRFLIWNWPIVILVFVWVIFVVGGKDFYPLIWPDEAYISDIALNLLKHGNINTDIWGDMLKGAKDYVYWYPPGLFIALALWFKLAGFSLESLRVLSLLSVLVLIVS